MLGFRLQWTPTLESTNQTYTAVALSGLKNGKYYQGSVWLSASYLELTRRLTSKVPHGRCHIHWILDLDNDGNIDQHHAWYNTMQVRQVAHLIGSGGTAQVSHNDNTVAEA